MYTLYGGRFTRALIVQMVLAEGKIEHELRPVDIINNEHRSEQFLAMNPAGYVPVLVKPDGEVLHETHAINLYLIDHHQLRQLGPMVDEPERGAFLSGLFFMGGDLEPVFKRIFYPNRYILHDEDLEEMKQLSIAQGIERLEVIDRKLQEDGPYYLGERFSLIDIIVCYWTDYIFNEVMFDRLPGIRRCMSLIVERPLLKPFFEELSECRIEYAKIQAEGGGVK